MNHTTCSPFKNCETTARAVVIPGRRPESEDAAKGEGIVTKTQGYLWGVIENTARRALKTLGLTKDEDTRETRPACFELWGIYKMATCETWIFQTSPKSQTNSENELICTLAHLADVIQAATVEVIKEAENV